MENASRVTTPDIEPTQSLHPMPHSDTTLLSLTINRSQFLVAAASAAHRPYRQHDDCDRNELQKHAHPHELLRPVRGTAAHHVDEAQHQHDSHRDDRSRNKIM